MSYASLRACVDDLERHRRLVRVDVEIDPYLEIAAVQRRLYASGGPAVLFERVRGSRFPALANLFGTLERSRFIFRDTLDRVRSVLALRADPAAALRRPWRHLSAPLTAFRSLPWRRSGGPVLAEQALLSDLPAIVSWPRDGGPFVTLPQVITEDPDLPGALRTNVGMYRVQLAGNAYATDREVGLHYQIHRGIGVHHQAALRRGEPLRVTIAVGGPPAHTLAAVMPMPEGISELVFAGMLAGRRFRYARVRAGRAHDGAAHDAWIVPVEADVVILGSVRPGRTKPEGPFGDHLGYYSLAHEYPVLDVEAVYCRRDAIWPFTVVGRPPQEDTTFGELIHELTAPLVPREIPGLRAMHAVDAAGVHPLLLAIGSERYVPWAERRPQEILTIANAILGFGQASLAKYLFIAAGEDDPALDVRAVDRFLEHVLCRVDWTRDLHFQTRTTIDTLDYSGTGLNEGSKVVIAAAGAPRRELGRKLPAELSLPERFRELRWVMPGVLAVSGPPYRDEENGRATRRELIAALETQGRGLEAWPLWVLVDDAEFTARTLGNFLWVTFTRSNPSHDLDGAGAFFEEKHWGARGPIVIDARTKPHHAPPLVEDPDVTRRVEALAARGGPLAGLY